jgi:hypothetical protein
VARALSPAKVSSVTIEERPEAEGPSALVIVPDNQLSLAIGKKGQNARLAAKLTGMRVDIKSESEVEAERGEGEETARPEVSALAALPAMTPALLATLTAAGVSSPAAIVEAGPEKLRDVVGGEVADALYAAAREWMAGQVTSGGDVADDARPEARPANP